DAYKTRYANKWDRQTIQRLIREKGAPMFAPADAPFLWNEHPNLVVPLLQWGGIGADNIDALQTPNPLVREWFVRSWGDEEQVPDAVAAEFARMAVNDRDIHVCSQLASTAKRLP